MTGPWISQTGHDRVVLVGRLVSGGECTTVFERHPDHWLMWPFGFELGAVRLAHDAVRRAAQQLLGVQP